MIILDGTISDGQTMWTGSLEFDQAKVVCVQSTTPSASTPGISRITLPPRAVLLLSSDGRNFVPADSKSLEPNRPVSKVYFRLASFAAFVSRGAPSYFNFAGAVVNEIRPGVTPGQPIDVEAPIELFMIMLRGPENGSADIQITQF